MCKPNLIMRRERMIERKNKVENIKSTKPKPIRIVKHSVPVKINIENINIPNDYMYKEDKFWSGYVDIREIIF